MGKKITSLLRCSLTISFSKNLMPTRWNTVVILDITILLNKAGSGAVLRSINKQTNKQKPQCSWGSVDKTRSLQHSGPFCLPEEDRSVSWRPALAYGDKSDAEPSFKILKIYFPNKEKANSCQIHGFFKKGNCHVPYPLCVRSNTESAMSLFDLKRLVLKVFKIILIYMTSKFLSKNYKPFN